MRIFCDGIVFENGYQRGIQRYFRDLFGRLSSTIDIEIALSSPAQATLPAGCRIHCFPGPSSGHLKRILTIAAARRAQKRRDLLESECDLFHSTFFTRSGSARLPEVVTVHDMILERFPHMFDESHIDGAIEQKRIAIESARLCIAISETTAEDIRRIHPSAGKKIRVVHHGADHMPAVPQGRPSARPDVAPAGRYAVFVGDRGKYKNFAVVKEAAASDRWPADLTLCVVGPEWSEDEMDAVRRMGVERRIIHLGRLADSDLADLYAHAVAAIVPSLWEGFGFPLLEAQSTGAPVVCSHIPVFGELLADTAAYFDPNRPETLCEALHQVESPEARENLRRLGFANAKRYTWARCAERTLEVYREAVQAAQRVGAERRPLTRVA